MHSSIFLAGFVPLAAAEACYSVVAKTHYVTSVVYETEYSTVAESSCTLADSVPSSTPVFEWLPPVHTLPAEDEEPCFGEDCGSEVPSSPVVPLPPVETAPGVTITTAIVVPTPSAPVEAPTASVPAEQSPEPSVPAEVPTVSVPAEIPTASVPAEVPTASVPAEGSTVSVPAEEVPTASVPAEIPTVSVPVEAPTGSVPAEEVPTVSIPVEEGPETSPCTTSTAEETLPATTGPVEEVPETSSPVEEVPETSTSCTTSTAEETAPATTGPVEEVPETSTPVEEVPETSTSCTTSTAEETAPATTSPVEEVPETSTSCTTDVPEETSTSCTTDVETTATEGPEETSTSCTTDVETTATEAPEETSTSCTTTEEVPQTTTSCTTSTEEAVETSTSCTTTTTEAAEETSTSCTTTTTEAAEETSTSCTTTEGVEATSSVVKTSTSVSTSASATAPTTLSSVASTTAASSTAAPSTTSEAISSVAPSSSSTSSEAPAQTNYVRNYPADIVDELQDDSMILLREWLAENNSNGCTLENASVRREWGDLSVDQRQDYIDAVICLQNAPSLYGNEVPGAESRFDDFVATHSIQTDYIHGTTNFLTWHRYFLHGWEQTLKSECGYQGVMPYWNWDRYADDLFNSPMFNGDATSLGGNSVNGRCVQDGPFASMSVNLGPGASLRSNPRCLQRQMSTQAAQLTKVEITYPLITQSNDIRAFQDRLQSNNNVHASGHFTIGGNPGGDIYTSPGDPYFHLHHAGIDRLYWIWQLQDLNTRLTAIAGTNGQTRRPGTLTELLNLGPNAGNVELQELLNTMGGLGGELCYIYY